MPGKFIYNLASDIGLQDSNRRILKLRRVNFEGCWSSLDSWLREFSTRRQIQNLKSSPHYVGRMLNVSLKMEHQENLILELRGMYTLESLYRHHPAYDISWQLREFSIRRKIKNCEFSPHYKGRMLNFSKKMEHEENLELRGKYTLESLYRHDPAYESSELHTLFRDSGTITPQLQVGVAILWRLTLRSQKKRTCRCRESTSNI